MINPRQVLDANIYTQFVPCQMYQCYLQFNNIAKIIFRQNMGNFATKRVDGRYVNLPATGRDDDRYVIIPATGIRDISCN